MNQFIKDIQQINTVEAAIAKLKTQITLSNKLEEILDFIILAHEGQYRKSGEPYCVHPILVAATTAYFSKEEAIIATALLHDIVEDTEYSLDFVEEKWGSDVAKMVDGLTKIVEIREHEFISSSSQSNEKLISSALTFRKMLIASIDDVRVLIVKLCDRLHNMLTLNALPVLKQKRIAEETLVVYVPIANRLGISTLKNNLEDLAFLHIYPIEYNKLDTFLKNQYHAMRLNFNSFISNTKDLLEKNGYDSKKIKIYSRIKHHYSIYLKMQRKGISVEEVLDMFAIRIIVPQEIDCYKVLGHMHLSYKPLLSRFKDYVAAPKENGYQTIHTTVFFNSKIFEIQIRTVEMHKIAEFGIAAHWKYKSGSKNTTNLNWLKSLEYSNDNVEEFYQDAKDNLYTEDIIVYSPKGEIFDLPMGSTALDFAYAVHTDVGKRATACYINKIKKPLLTQLKNTDIVKIDLSDKQIARCSWIDMVKTSKAKKQIKMLCANKQKEINLLSGENILNTIFSKYHDNIVKKHNIPHLNKIPENLAYLKDSKINIERKIIQDKGIMTRFKIFTSKLKKFRFDNILLYSNFNVSTISFDHCCHPKFGDEIISLRNGNDAIIHHKMCDKAYDKIIHKHQMLFCKWIEDTQYKYKMVVSLPNTKGELSRVLSYMAQYEIYILQIEYGRQKHSYRQYCHIEFEINNSNLEEVRRIIEHKAKVIEFSSKKDAYNK